MTKCAVITPTCCDDGIHIIPPHEYEIQENVSTRRGIDRVACYAFKRANRHRNSLTSAAKSNGMFQTMPFWEEIVDEVTADYLGVSTRKVLIDAMAAEVVGRPHEFDVIASSNLLGYILSNLASS